MSNLNLGQMHAPPITGVAPPGVSPPMVAGKGSNKNLFRPAPVTGAGVGPLAGWLADGNQLKATFADQGKSWIPVQDKWGNAFVLLLGDAKSYAWKVDKRSGQSAETCANSYYLDKSSEAFGVFEQACSDNLGANGLDAGNIPDQPLNPYSGGIIGTPDAVQVDSWNYFGAADTVTDGNGLQLKPYPSYGRYIDNVPVKLPVSDDLAKDFGGWFVVRIDRYTRSAVLTGLYFQSWGDLTTMRSKLCSLDTLAAAIVKTLLGLIEIVVGVLCIVGTFGGCSAAGVAMIVGGVITIVEGWYTFDAQRKAHEEAVKKALATASETGRAGGKGHLDGLTKQGSKNQNWTKWLMAAAVVVVPVAAKSAALI